MAQTYKLIDIQTDDIIAEAQSICDLREILNDTFQEDDSLNFDTADINVVEIALQGCDYTIEEE